MYCCLKTENTRLKCPIKPNEPYLFTILYLIFFSLSRSFVCKKFLFLEYKVGLIIWFELWSKGSDKLLSGKMTRRRIQIKKIDNTTARLVAFSKRRKGLFKKAFELSTLCDAEIGLMVFSATGKLFEYASSRFQSLSHFFLLIEKPFLVSHFLTREKPFFLSIEKYVIVHSLIALFMHSFMISKVCVWESERPNCSK